MNIIGIFLEIILKDLNVDYQQILINKNKFDKIFICCSHIHIIIN